MSRQGLRPIKGAMPAQKAVEGSKTETDFIAGRNGKEVVYLTSGH